MEKVTSADGTAIAFERTGTGPALVITGGALNTRHSPGPLVPLLAGHFTVYTYDRRGRGDSGDTPPYAPEREVEDLAALIAAAGGTAYAYGHSSGAALVLRAMIAGAGVARAALYEPPYALDAAEAAAGAEAGRRIAGLIGQGRRGDALEAFMTGVGLPRQMIGQMRSTPMWAALEAVAHTLPYDFALTGGGLPRVSGAGGPVLVLDGGDSPEWMRATARALAAALPRGAHLTLDGQGHDVAPDVIAPVLTEFFTRP
ncbi:pimeloyl-ACP methyl ester carboxylesterase [Thermocatellispora tengchongensis]|uniref:Pimeloyl-ACP methyl ester carboxylesterase n=1 Tax=Thermocatellispora tengchongensis TaxID=1073253 RepID=A0A840PLT5_9ACTN|nr:alpha/beta hydrolase [Thermocatellispora tengchongensis]MBB5137005.1 pimeloyl-ACP methyl ester carboxylesterase [Thermocatellispora tengchongensis]